MAERTEVKRVRRSIKFFDDDGRYVTAVQMKNGWVALQTGDESRHRVMLDPTAVQELGEWLGGNTKIETILAGLPKSGDVQQQSIYLGASGWVLRDDSDGWCSVIVEEISANTVVVDFGGGDIQRVDCEDFFFDHDTEGK